MILVTGGLGYLGGRISQHLLDLGEKVRIGSSQVNVSLPQSLNGCELVHLDLFDRKSLDSACDGVTSVVHLAALNAQMSADAPELALMINGMGTLKLLSSAVKNDVEKFMYFSTVHVYGSPLRGIINEELLPRPVHPYSITHRLAEDYVLEANSKGSLSGSVFRISNAVGPPLTKEANCWMLVVNDLCRQVVIDKNMKISSARHIKRDYLSITDISHVVSKVVLDEEINQKVRGELINISNGKSMTLDYLAKVIAQRSQSILGYTPGIEFGDNTSLMVDEPLLVSNQKATSIGFTLGTDLLDEIDSLLLSCERWFGVSEL